MPSDNDFENEEETDDWENQTSFLASFPPTSAAIKVSGLRDGMNIQLAVPESELVNALRCQLWRGKLLRVTLEVIDDENAQHEKRPRRKRRRALADQSDENAAPDENATGAPRTSRGRARRGRIESGD